MGHQKGEISCPVKMVKSNRRGKTPPFPGNDSANERPWTSCSLDPSLFLPLPCWDLYMLAVVADPILQFFANPK